MAAKSGTKKGSAASKKLTMRQRKNRARKYWLRGYGTSEIANALGISEQTARNYIKEFKEELEEEVKNNPDYLDKILENTQLELRRLDDREQQAWDMLALSERVAEKTALLTLIQKIGEQRAKVNRLLDVRVEVITKAERATALQETLINWLSNNLCVECAEEFERFLQQLSDVQEAIGAPKRMIPIEGESIEEACA